MVSGVPRYFAVPWYVVPSVLVSLSPVQVSPAIPVPTLMSIFPSSALCCSLQALVIL